MEEIENKSTENKKQLSISKKINMLEYKWFFGLFNENERNEIFEIIYISLFKENVTFQREESPGKLEDYINSKDSIYTKKKPLEIFNLFNLKEKEINKNLEKYNVKLVINYRIYLCIEDNNNKRNFLTISCLRKIRFEEQFEWICNPGYLLYFQYFVLNYEKPSRVEIINENNEEKIDTIDSVIKANKILNEENFIYIKDSGVQKIDFDEIFENSNKDIIFSKENILKYFDYNNNDPKQIINSDLSFENNYKEIIDFCLEPHFDNLIYAFQNGYYFFELNLMRILYLYQRKKFKFFYLNFNKIKKIFNNKYLFKQYLGFWLAKLFPKDINEDNKTDFHKFAVDLIDSSYKKRDKFLQIILEKINEIFEITIEQIKAINIEGIRNKILVILNNIDISDIQLIEKKNFLNVNILFILNIQDNFDAFLHYYCEEYKYKQFFLENEDELNYKEPSEEDKNERFYSTFVSISEYENSRKELIDQILNQYERNTDKLLNIAFILNISEYINKLNNDQQKSYRNLKFNLGMPNNLQMIKPFCPLININVSDNENHTIFKIDNIKFKEMFVLNHLKKYICHI